MIQLSDRDIEKLVIEARVENDWRPDLINLARLCVSILGFIKHPLDFWAELKLRKLTIRRFKELPPDEIIEELEVSGLAHLFVEVPDLVVRKIREAKKYYQQFRNINPEHPEAKEIPPSWLKLAKEWEKQKTKALIEVKEEFLESIEQEENS